MLHPIPGAVELKGLPTGKAISVWFPTYRGKTRGFPNLQALLVTFCVFCHNLSCFFL